MADSIAKQLQVEATKSITEARIPGSSLAKLLNECLTRYLNPGYFVNAGQAVDSEGRSSESFDSLVHTSSKGLAQVPADNLACAIDIHQNLGLQELRASYEKIAQIKQLKKSPRSKRSSGFTPADATMGIVFALDSGVPLEGLAQELEQLNKGRSYHEWTDMIVVLSRGTINYACQFPDKPLGDFLPPTRDGIMLAPMYIHIFARAHAAFSLNRMFSILFPYLFFFSPDATPPPYQKFLEDAPNTGMTIAPYQFNLNGEMVPVPTELRFNKSFVFPLGFQAEDGKGNVLSRVQYLPWQDGGVIRTSGRLPIEAFLVFVGSAAAHSQIIRLPDAQISSILPLSRQQFIQMAERTARQSNLVIKPDKRPSFLFERIADEGTSSPFYARLFAGILRLRDQAIPSPKQREDFDKAYQTVTASLESIRAAAKTIATVYSSHSQKVARGEIARVIFGNSIQLDESIDKELRKQVETVISGSARVFKDRMQDVLRSLNVDLGFLYRQQSSFNNGIAKLRQSDPKLSAYLEETRMKWSERLTVGRIALEHQGWVLPKVQYVAESGSLRTIEPLIDDQPVTGFVAHMVDHVCCFVEDLCASTFQAQMPDGISLTEVPLNERKPELKERFQLALVGGGMPVWTISYHDTTFDET